MIRKIFKDRTGSWTEDVTWRFPAPRLPGKAIDAYLSSVRTHILRVELTTYSARCDLQNSIEDRCCKDAEFLPAHNATNYLEGWDITRVRFRSSIQL